jgi:5,10-methylenetetrahydrofolate reductase
MKIIDKIQERVKDGKTFFSFEFFPPRTEEVCYNASFDNGSRSGCRRAAEDASAWTNIQLSSTANQHRILHWDVCRV